MKCTHDLAIAKISELVKINNCVHAFDEFGVGVSDDKDLDDYLKFENKWALAIGPDTNSHEHS